jgi:beta-lactamase regulating signal transducer with metallopeptidase domain
MSALGSLPAHPAVRLLGWALLHFLWEGAVVAALLAGVLALLRRQSANARYLAAGAALLAMAAAPGLTMVALRAGPDRSVSLAGAPPAFSRASVTPAAPSAFSSLPTITAPLRWEPHGRASGALRRVASVVDRLLPALVAGWLVGVILLSVRLLGGWVAVQRLPRRGCRPISGPLAERAAELASRLGVRRPVRFLESSTVTVPIVLGWVRAAILVPAGAVTGLPLAHLEALLAHELAHIRRHDYLVNFLQAAVETMLFYHPAVWWVSHCLRVEREHCCDDLAVRALGDRVTYARALTALETFRGAGAPLVLAGSGGSLLARIRRILGLPPERTGLTPAGLGGMMVLALLLTSAVLLCASAADSPRLQSPSAPTVVAAAARTAAPPSAGVVRHPPILLRAHAIRPRAEGQPAARSRAGQAATPSHAGKSAAGHARPFALLEVPVARVRVVAHGATVARVQLLAAHAAPDRANLRVASLARPHPVQVKPAVRLAANAPAAGKRPAAPGVVQGVPGQHVEDVAILDLRGVPPRQVAEIQSLKDIAVLVLDEKNRGALRASMEDVGSTVIASSDLRLSVEPFLELSKATLEAMPASQKLLQVGVVAFRPDVPPSLVAQKFASLQVTGVLLASAGVRGALLGRMQITGSTVPLPDNAGPFVHSVGENKLTTDYLSRLSDGSVYLNIGETEIAPDVTEELLARKIQIYCNIGNTSAAPPLINLLKSRCPANLGSFTESQAAAH